jgi:hypothetical protein
VRKFVETEIIPHAFEWDEAKKIPQELFIKAGKAGILPAVCGAPWPGKYVLINE